MYRQLVRGCDSEGVAVRCNPVSVMVVVGVLLIGRYGVECVGTAPSHVR